MADITTETMWRVIGWIAKAAALTVLLAIAMPALVPN